jgi:hypothetical protein
MKTRTTTLGTTLFFVLGLYGFASAGTFFGALSNFDAVNDTGAPCNGFEIELDDIHSQDVTYTFQFQRYGVPKITEDTFLDQSNVSHARTFVRWMSSYDQVNHVFTQRTLAAAPGFANTGGHLCFGANVVNGSPYDLSGCEHFGLGTLTNPSNTAYRWMKEDPTTPGNLVPLGNPVTIPAPVWTVPAGPNPLVAAVVPVPPPPAVVPVPFLPNAEFGIAVWAKVFETESADKADLDHLTSDDPAVPGNDGPVPNPNTVPEIEWQILQTDTMNPTANELKSERALGNGNESVTRRYEFYKYVGLYDTNPDSGTNEALCAHVALDDQHGTLGNNGVDCTAIVVVGDYIGAQNAAADVAMPLTANGANLNDGEVGVHYPNRPLIFGGSAGPYSIGFTGGTLPATDAGNDFTLNQTNGVLSGGVPNGAGMATFTVHATDLVEPAQPAVDATFNITVVAAVTVDDVVIPDGVPNVETAVDLTASGGETPFIWGATPITAGLQASVVGNTLSLTGNAAGAFDVHVTVDDVLGGTHAKTLTYHVSAPVQPTTTPTSTAIAPTPTDTATPSPTATPTLTATATATPTASATSTTTATPTVVPTPVSAKAAEKCRAALVSAAASLVQVEAKAEHSCEDKKVRGKLPHDTSCAGEAKTSAAITRARSKLVDTVAKACGGKDKTCGASGNDDLPLASAGWQAPACPDVEGGACTNAIATCADIASCLTCIGEATVDEAISLYYDDLVETDPGVKAQKALNKCQATIGSAATTFLAAKSKALQKCWAAVNAGHATGTCPAADGKAAGVIAKAESKKVAAICKACGGADKVCGGGDDFTPAQIGFATNCPDVTPPGAASCAGAITTLQNIVDCVDCVSEFEVDCATGVAVPALAAYPTECNP